MSLSHPGIESHVIPFSSPRIRRVVQQIANLEAIVAGRGCVDAYVAVLHVMRIEVHDRENAFVAIRRCLRISDDFGIVGLAEVQRPVGLQRVVRVPNLVEAAHQLVDVAGAVPVPFSVLILFRVCVFLAAWRDVLMRGALPDFGALGAIAFLSVVATVAADVFIVSRELEYPRLPA